MTTIRTSATISALVLTFCLALPSLAQKHEQGRPNSGEDFFIVSSVDAKKNQLVLKHPTEVTELMVVTEKTVYLSEQGKPLKFGDFRAGDTVYVISSPSAGGARLATRIRKGAMTLEELHRRYLRAANSEE